MASKIAITNVAMALLGEETIVSLTSNLGEKERKVNALFDITRDEVLQAFPWKFAKKQMSLGLLSQTPLYGYDYSYQVPSDCLRILDLNNGCVFDRVGDAIHTNEEEALVTYIRRVVDTGLWDSTFVNAFSSKLAMKLAESLTNSTSLQQTLKQYYDEAIKEARGISSQEGVQAGLYSDVLSEARYA